MALVTGGFGGAIALALFGDHMDQHRPRRPRLDRAQHRQQLVQVMPVNRPEIGKPKLFEQRTAHGHALEHILGALGPFAERAGQHADSALGRGFEILKRLFGIKTAEVGRHRPHRRRDRHLVVVQDDEHPFFQMARVVHRLIGHARRHRPIADHRNRIAQTFGDIAAQITRHRKAQSRADRGRRMRRTKGVVGGFTAFGKSAQPVFHTQGADTVAAFGQDLMRVALVAHIPDQLVLRRIEHRMDRDRQFNHAQTRAQMAARL